MHTVVALIVHLRTCVINSKIQGRSLYVVKVIYMSLGTSLNGKNSLPQGANSFL